MWLGLLSAKRYLCLTGGDQRCPLGASPTKGSSLVVANERGEGTSSVGGARLVVAKVREAWGLISGAIVWDGGDKVLLFE